MHKYNNQDHSMYTAMLTVENIHGARHDIWSVNVEEEYHETSEVKGPGRPSGTDRTGRAGPAPTRRLTGAEPRWADRGGTDAPGRCHRRR